MPNENQNSVPEPVPQPVSPLASGIMGAREADSLASIYESMTKISKSSMGASLKKKAVNKPVYSFDTETASYKTWSIPPANAVRIEHVDPIAPPAPKGPTLKSFALNEQEFAAPEWTTEKIESMILSENWRERENEETVEVGDLIHFLPYENEPARYEKIKGWKGMVITEELLNNHGLRILTTDGASKSKAPIVFKETTEFSDIYSVPSGVRLNLPSSKEEAARFFKIHEDEIIPFEVIEKGVPKKRYCPNLPKMVDKKFRVAFSRIFVDFAKKNLKKNIRDLIPGRGHGIQMTRGQSPKLSIKDQLRMPNTPPAFIEKIKMRDLTPHDFRYDKAIGIEIETVCPYSHDVSQRRLQEDKAWNVRAGTDGSIRDEKGNKPDGISLWGVEFRLLIKRDQMEQRLSKALESINRMGVSVNKSCGLHVHFDMRYHPSLSLARLPERERQRQELEARQLHEKEVHNKAERLSKWLKQLKELIPESRRNNQYCTLDFMPGEHYSGVSTHSFKKHGTIEVRLHSGTTDYVKIVNWIRLIETIMTLKFSPIGNISTLEALKSLPLSDADKDYWRKRHQDLNKGMYKAGQKLERDFYHKPAEIE